MLTKAIMASIKPETTEALESAPVLAGDVVALITVQPPPVQNWKHLSASHRKVHPPAVQCWLHSSELDRQVMLHSPPVQICSHLLELHSNNLHPPPCAELCAVDDGRSADQRVATACCTVLCAFIIRRCRPTNSRTWLWRTGTLAGLVACQVYKGSSAR